MQNVVKAEIAAVPVTKSRLISERQSWYSGFVSQRSGLEGGQTQVPPESDTIVAFTEMMYAIAKNVARPALISVKKKEFGRSRG